MAQEKQQEKENQKKVNQKSIYEELEFDSEVSITILPGSIEVKGKKASIKRLILHKNIDFAVSDNTIIVSSQDESKKVKKMINSYKAHIKNMIRGVKEPYTYRLKVCSGHFPMNVHLEKNKLVIKNFFGEKYPRTVELKEGVQVKIENDIITVQSADKELAGQTSATIEQLTRRPGYDPRIFQDGIYVITKDGKELK